MSVYQVLEFGESVGEGQSGALHCTLAGVAKLDSEESAYAVANEFICGRIGLLRGLPVPPGVMVATNVGTPAYVSLRFGELGERPPPVIPQQLVDDHPALAGGVIVFDTWIGNGDRHRRNLAYSRGVQPPVVFDHDQALLGSFEGRGVIHLSQRRDEAPAHGCLNGLLTEASEIAAYADRVKQIQRPLIEQICREAAEAKAITQEEAEEVIAYLTHRQGCLDSLLASQTPNVNQERLL